MATITASAVYSSDSVSGEVVVEGLPLEKRAEQLQEALQRNECGSGACMELLDSALIESIREGTLPVFERLIGYTDGSSMERVSLGLEEAFISYVGQRGEKSFILSNTEVST